MSSPTSCVLFASTLAALTMVRITMVIDLNNLNPPACGGQDLFVIYMLYIPCLALELPWGSHTYSLPSSNSLKFTEYEIMHQNHGIAVYHLCLICYTAAVTYCLY